jgi:hypothetical protein
VRSPLRRLKRLGVIPRLAEDLAAAKVEGGSHVEDLAAVIAFGLDRPQISGASDPAHGERRLGLRREAALRFAHRFAAVGRLAGLRHPGDEVLVAKLVPRVGVQVRQRRGQRCSDFGIGGAQCCAAPVHRDLWLRSTATSRSSETYRLSSGSASQHCSGVGSISVKRIMAPGACAAAWRACRQRTRERAGLSTST